jgi:hypothetical protein
MNPVDVTKDPRNRDWVATIFRGILCVREKAKCAWIACQNRTNGECYKRAIETATLLAVVFYGWTAYEQYKQVTTANQETTMALHATERAYVTLGSNGGVIADLTRIDSEDANKPYIVIYFMNSGRSVARHFALNVSTNIGTSGSGFSYRHRFKGVRDLKSELPGNEVDIGAQSAYTAYITDSKVLKTEKELFKDPSVDFSIFGDFAYCDIFGEYHCQAFMARFDHALTEFRAQSFLACVPNEPSQKNLLWYKANGYTETNPCEQPGEPEYIKPARDFSAK